MTLLKQKLKFEGCFSVEKEGNSGSLELLWMDDLDASNVSYTKHHINAIIKGKDKDDWRFFDFYGHPDQSKRSQSWELLGRLKSMCSLP